MPDTPSSPKTGGRLVLMENLLGLLRIRVIRGVNLAVRDVRSSDPYVVIKMGKQVSVSRCFFHDRSPSFFVRIRGFVSLGRLELLLDRKNLLSYWSSLSFAELRSN